MDLRSWLKTRLRIVTEEEKVYWERLSKELTPLGKRWFRKMLLELILSEEAYELVKAILGPEGLEDTKAVVLSPEERRNYQQLLLKMFTTIR
jgi:hypothetical protein